MLELAPISVVNTTLLDLFRPSSLMKERMANSSGVETEVVRKIYSIGWSTFIEVLGDWAICVRNFKSIGTIESY